MAKKTLFLHIGHLKTGTSAFQDFCNRHREALRTLGVCYPSAGTGHRRRGNHLVLSLGLAEAYGRQTPPWYQRAKDHHPEEYDYRNQWEHVLTEIAESDCEKAVISSEFFFALGMGGNASQALQILRELVAAFEVRIITYLRRPDRMIESFYNQVIKTGSPMKRLYGDVARFKSTPFLDFTSSLSSWLAAFGSEGLTVRNYDQLLDRDIVVDIFSLANCPAAVRLRSRDVSEPVNQRMPHALIELKRLANCRHKGQHRHDFVLEAFSKLQADHRFPPDRLVSVLSESDRTFLYQHTLALNGALAEMFPTPDSVPFFGAAESILETPPGTISDADAAERFAGLLAVELALALGGVRSKDHADEAPAHGKRRRRET